MVPKRARWWGAILALGLACAPPDGDEAVSGGESGGTEGDGEVTDGEAELLDGAVNGQCVPPGTRFLDVYSCTTVRGPTPTQPPVSKAYSADPQAALDDPDYDWVVEQLQACACACCHREGGIGSYRWSHDFPGAWIDSVDADALDTMLFGSGPDAIDPELNNGFSRRLSTLPTTDADRMLDFLVRESDRRP